MRAIGGQFCERGAASPSPRVTNCRRPSAAVHAPQDRDTRTVFAYNLNLKAEEKEIFQLFRWGRVLQCRGVEENGC